MKNKNTSYLKSFYFSGFTLIELLVLVAEVMLAMAVLLFSGFVSQRRVEAAANELQNAFSVVRSEAIKASLGVHLISISNHFKPGWVLITDSSASPNADTHCIDVKALDGQGFFSQTQSNSIKLTGRDLYPGGLRQRMEFCDASRSSDIDKNAVSIEPSGFANRGQYGSFAT
jgi:Tfp pilus assembly protein FimT